MKHSTPISDEQSSKIKDDEVIPMMYVPHDFFTSTQLAIEDAIGYDKYGEILYDAGYKSAYHWCEKESEANHLTGIAVFEHYLNRLSLRGWGNFSFESVNAETGHAEIKLMYSSFVLSQPEKPGKLCNMFCGWFAGAMDWCTDRKGHLAHTNCEDFDCASDYCGQSKCANHAPNYCIFTIKPSTVEPQSA